MNPDSELQQLFDTMPQTGRVTWIGVRPDKHTPITSQITIDVDEKGLVGDRYSRKNGKRSVTLIQHEHLAAVSSIMGIEVTPELVRRNIVVSSINLLALKDRTFQVGNVILEYTGLCHPCSKMEKALGAGGYNAMRGHGGITARVVESGRISVDDVVHMKPNNHGLSYTSGK